MSDSVSDLEEILVYARRRLRWLLTSGQVWPTRLISNVRHDPAQDLFQKYLAEYALLLMLARRSGRLDARGRESVGSAALELQLLTSSAHGHFKLRASPYACCSTAGFTLTVLQALTGRRDHLTDLVRRHSQTHEHAHYGHATMARHWWLRLLMGLPEEPWHAQERSVLHRLLTTDEHPVYMSTGQLYEITHVAFFLGDFGRRAVLRPDCVPAAQGLLDGAIARTLATADADLVAEAVMTQLALQLPLTEYSLEALDYLHHLFSSRRLSRLTPEQEAQAVEGPDSAHFETQPPGMLYHLVLVYGMLQAMLPVEPPVPATSHGRPESEALRLATVGALERANLWLAERRGSPEPRSGAATQPPAGWLTRYLPPSVRGWLESRSVAPAGDDARSRLVLDAVLIRALLDYDLPNLARGLVSAADRGLPRTWTQNAMLRALLDQQLPSGAFGGLIAVDRGRTFGESVATTSAVAHSLRRLVVHPSMPAPVGTGG